MTRLLIKAPAAAVIMAALLLFLCQAALAASPQVFYILDASGSMWGRAGDQMKIQAARQVMEQVVPQTPAEAAIGLAAYGHRTRGDCSDVEILAMPGQISREEVLKKINAIQPKGKTPIAATLKLVADKIGGADAETIMVLVSDGLETCDPDPCGVVKALKKRGVKFVLHVVGFGVDDKGKAQLSCLAEAGGGKYFSAADAASLLAAMEQVNKDVAQKIEQAKTTQVKAKTGLGKLHITMPADTAVSLAEIKIIRPKDGKVVKKAKSAADATHPLISGEYRIVLGFANTNYKPPTDVEIGTVTVKPGETTELKLGGIYPNLAKGLNEAVAAVEIRQSGAKEPLLLLEPGGNDYYLFRPKPLPAGKYDFYLRNGRSPRLGVAGQGRGGDRGQDGRGGPGQRHPDQAAQIGQCQGLGSGRQRQRGRLRPDPPPLGQRLAHFQEGAGHARRLRRDDPCRRHGRAPARGPGRQDRKGPDPGV